MHICKCFQYYVNRVEFDRVEFGKTKGNEKLKIKCHFLYIFGVFGVQIVGTIHYFE